MITAKIIEDSLNDVTGTRLTTMIVRFHRFILPEVLTHRVFSRNTSSSRAVPVSKRIDMVMNSPAVPISFGKSASTMYSTEENEEGIMSPELCDLLTPEQAWIEMSQLASKYAKAFADSKYHKQVVNRLLEPFTWTDMVISSTDWDNFFKLRISYDAQPEICELATKMKEALDASTPKVLNLGEWHLPFVSEDERGSFSIDVQKQLSVVRCARVSYKTDKDQDYDAYKDIALFKQLRDSGHFSPFEHVAEVEHFDNEMYSSNFREFIQYRAYVEDELAFKGAPVNEDN